MNSTKSAKTKLIAKDLGIPEAMLKESFDTMEEKLKKISQVINETRNGSYY